MYCVIYVHIQYDFMSALTQSPGGRGWLINIINTTHVGTEIDNNNIVIMSQLSRPSAAATFMSSILLANLGHPRDERCPLRHRIADLMRAKEI